MSERLQGVSALYCDMCDKCFFSFFFKPITTTPPRTQPTPPLSADRKSGSCFQMPRCETSYDPGWAAGAPGSEKVSQIMAPDRSPRHKMTDPGQNGLSSTFSGKFPIKMLIQAVERERKKIRRGGGKTGSGAVAAVSVFPPSTGFRAQFFGECCKQLAVRGRPHDRRPPG